MAALLLLALLAAGWWLPPLAERLLRRELDRRGLGQIQFHVQTVTPWTTVLGPVRAGRDDRAPQIEQVRIRYAPRRLWRTRQVDAIWMVGARLELEARDGAWHPAGLPAELLAALRAPSSAQPRQPARFPVGCLVLRSGRLLLLTDAAAGAGVVIPFDARLEPDKGDALGIELQAHLGAGELVGTGDWDLGTGGGRFLFRGERLPLGLLAELARHTRPDLVPSELRVAGSLSARGTVELAANRVARLEWNAELAAPAAAGADWAASLPLLRAEGTLDEGGACAGTFSGALGADDGGGEFTAEFKGESSTRDVSVAVRIERVALAPLLARLRQAQPALLPADLRVTGHGAARADATLADGRLATATFTAALPSLEVAGTAFAAALAGLELTGTATPERVGLAATGTLTRLVAGERTLADDGAALAAFEALAELALTSPRSGALTARVQPTAALLLPLLPARTTLAVTEPECQFQVEATAGSAGAWEAVLRWTLGETAFRIGRDADRLAASVAASCSATWQAGTLAASADVRLSDVAGEAPALGRFGCRQAALTARLAPMRLSADALSSAAGAAAGLRGAEFAGELTAADGHLRTPQGGEADGLALRVPFTWSPAAGFADTQAATDATLPAALAWDRLAWRDVRLMPGVMRVTLTGQGASGETEAAVAGSVLAATATWTASWAPEPRLTAEVRLRPARLTSADPALKPFADALRGLDFAADVDGSVTARLENGRFQARGACRLERADLAWPEHAFSAQGISTGLVFPALPELRTEPAQTLSFAGASVAGLPLDGGDLRFAIEAPDRVLLERADLRWCGGWVRAYALRFDPRRPEGDVVLYIDRIQVEPFLKLFKSLGAQGSGTLYGRLPLSLRSGRIRFSEGYFFSLPGQTGNLQITDQQWLAQSLAAGMDARTAERVRNGLADLDYSVFRVDLQAADAQDATLRFRIFGRSRRDPTLPPVDLNVNVNGPLEQLFNLGLQMSRGR